MDKLEGKCWNCGTRPEHMDSEKQCRPCGERCGDRYLYVSEIDHDKLRAKLGIELAAEVIIECKEN